MTDFKKWFAARARNPDRITLEEAFEASKQSAPSIPEGWTLVPIEPTQEMITAALESTHVLNAHRAVACYDAMLAAAKVKL